LTELAIDIKKSSLPPFFYPPSIYETSLSIYFFCFYDQNGKAIDRLINYLKKTKFKSFMIVISKFSDSLMTNISSEMK
jgi:hypothetical protein